VVGGESVARGKPAPDLFLEAAARIGAEPARCVVFEDALAGVAAAQAAGMRCAGVATVLAPEELLAAGASWALGDFTELPAELRAAIGLA
jgi:beta-phosphoglucomutase-like phosphatase (HAD superfamily)